MSLSRKNLYRLVIWFSSPTETETFLQLSKFEGLRRSAFFILFWVDIRNIDCGNDTGGLEVTTAKLYVQTACCLEEDTKNIPV